MTPLARKVNSSLSPQMHDMGTQQFQNGQQLPLEKMCQNGTVAATGKPAIERGASWSYGETKILLALWGQDMVQRQLTKSKRTRPVWEKIAQRIRENGYDRTAGLWCIVLI